MISDATLRRLLRSDDRVALLGDLLRGLAGVAIVVLVAWYAQYYAVLVRVMFVTLHMNDFGKFYYSARAALSGGDMYAPNPATAIPVGPTTTWQLGNMNPPHFHLPLLPLAALDPLPAYVAWTALSLVALGLTLRLIARTLDLPWTWTGGAWTLAAVVVPAATGTTVATGQVSFAFALPMAVAWAEARRGRWLRAAALLGVLASVKPFLGVFGLYFLVTRRLAATATMAAVGAVVTLIGVAVFGVHAYARWLGVLGGVDWSWALMNGSLAGPVTRAFVRNPFFTPLADLPNLAGVLTTGLALVVLAVTLAAVARDRSAQAVDRAFALVICAALLASPLGWVYYLWLGVGPCLAVAASAGTRTSAARGWWWLAATPGLVAPVPLTLAWSDRPWGAVTIGSIYTWSLLALWLGLLADWRVRGADPYLSGAK